MNIFQKRIENLCDEIIGRILALMQANSVSEVILKDNDNPVYVIWFDKTGDPCECSVHKVTAVGEGITLEVHDKITGENYKVTSRPEAALANPVWLNDILEAMTNIFQIKNTGLEENIICCKCGGNHVSAMPSSIRIQNSSIIMMMSHSCMDGVRSVTIIPFSAT